MATGYEKRRVAAELREYASWDDEGDLVDCRDWGERVLNLLDCGDTEGECYAALADLIDPDTTTDTTKDTTKSQTISLSPSLCDRDALLAIADEMDIYTRCPDDDRCGKQMPPLVIHYFTHRIREACGLIQEG